MARQVCYSVEEVGNQIVITQQWTEKKCYIKMSRASAHWVAQQLWNLFNGKQQHDALPEKAKAAEVARAQKVADYLFGGEDGKK